jgi:hypothetical protein
MLNYQRVKHTSPTATESLGPFREAHREVPRPVPEILENPIDDWDTFVGRQAEGRRSGGKVDVLLGGWMFIDVYITTISLWFMIFNDIL